MCRGSRRDCPILPAFGVHLQFMGVRTTSLRLYRAANADARHWQILALSGLFSISFFTSDFGTTPWSLVAAFSGAMLAQVLGTVWANRSADSWFIGFQWKSALITTFGLTILLRADSLWLWFAAGLIGVGAKFLIRYRGKHLFNPACIGIVVVALLAGREAWVSPGQWGQAPIFAAFAIGFAALVLSSAKRLDIALGFLGGFAIMLIGRALYLGDPMAIPLHQMQSGALLVFAFFMITDPRSTPDSRVGRFVFAFAVAALAAWLSWRFHIRGSMLYALAGLAILTPILDRLLPAKRFEWTSKEGHIHETETPTIRVRARPRFLRA